MRKSLLTSVAVASLVLASSPAMADGPSLGLRVEPGVAVPLTPPQTDRFHPGGYVAVKPTLALTPWFEANLTLSGMALPSKIDGIDYGQTLGAGVGARLKLPTGDRTGWAAIQPWIDGDAQYVRTGVLDRSMFSIGVGATVPVNASQSVRIGPTVRYLDVFESFQDRPSLDNRDAHILVVGLALEFGAGRKQQAAPPPPAPPPPAPPPVVEVPKKKLVAPPPEPVTVTETVHGIIQFPYDSSVPLPESSPVLQEALRLLTDHADIHVTLEGHASSEGTEQYNQALSERRATAVKNFLVSNGVAADRLTIKGFGEDRPVADNATEAGRRLNRRVEYNVTLTFTRDGGSK
jgi:OOP family OmpA-OmpF porin